MGLLSKRALSIQQFQFNSQLFACPICQQGIEISNEGKMSCLSNHTFDVAKQGYVYMLNRPIQSMYGKELFESRHTVIQAGIYDRLQAAIAREITVEQPVILDTGCGEGSHLHRICEQLDRPVGVGIDISKEGIIAAAKYNPEQLWCVGDLANSPFNEQSFDAILNILSPANYDEFKRLLKRGGKVIKVVPQENYLKELRKQAFANSEKESYTNAETVERFKASFANAEVKRITYTVPLEAHLVQNLLEMTPMGWHINDKESIQLQEITIDLDLLIGME
ncbi:Ribosomal RNA large subunit methyltransferase A [Solibacillus isronensis B3W22]|uniref:Ribosomal RNA large subunit methyltransferase A n=1 Tax=Solibacillus isronensis B3W22 TaxID=1224748 RepID=K1KS51_9BACL|nr:MULTISPECIES: methyltransferase domain-containing protein [Solibacillus]AMO87189.1 SAM-dependent methyltransferase [Solibacillus silvestris]EKB45276.1 Ribosomal RNA large subunit methyltransferase A [Solibacillus isronensis B3W22]OBW59520.1 SAM-dependent methyltransferase [Solibacillus silvestris]